jgi:hypothetical protein
MATTRKPRTDWFLFLDCFFTSGSTVEQFRSGAEFHLSREIHRGRIANAGLPTPGCQRKIRAIATFQKHACVYWMSRSDQDYPA